jgi:hypothetical protein
MWLDDSSTHASSKVTGPLRGCLRKQNTAKNNSGNIRLIYQSAAGARLEQGGPHGLPSREGSEDLGWARQGWCRQGAAPQGCGSWQGQC